MSTFAYLGQIGNRDLNDVIHGNGFYAVNDTNVVHSLNNYPDDSALTYKIAYTYADIIPFIKLYYERDYYGERGYEIPSDEIPSDEIPSDKLTLYRQLYLHMSGTGPKVITGTLEIVNNDDFTMQTFHRLPDDSTWTRKRLNNKWTDWKYDINKETFLLQMADDIKLNRSNVNIGIQHYSPIYDDRPIRDEITKKVDQREYDTKLTRKNPVFTGRMTVENGNLISFDDIVLGNANNTSASDKSISVMINNNEYPLIRTSYSNPSNLPDVVIGNGFTYFDVRRDFAEDRFPLFWNDGNDANRLLLREHLYWTYKGSGRNLTLSLARKNYMEILVIVYNNVQANWISSFHIPTQEDRQLSLCVPEWGRVADPEFVYTYNEANDTITVSSTVFNLDLYAR